MTRKRRTTLSDDPFEQRVYEEAGRREEEELVIQFEETLDLMPPPKGWHGKQGPGRPRKHRRGAPELYTWKGMMLVLMLKAYHGLTNREMSSHLRANPTLYERLGLPCAPSHTSVQRAAHRYPESWLKRMNQNLIPPKKRGREDRVIRIPLSTPPASLSKGKGAGKRSASTSPLADATIAN
jgi:hypothetical protein